MTRKKVHRCLCCPSNLDRQGHPDSSVVVKRSFHCQTPGSNKQGLFHIVPSGQLCPKETQPHPNVLRRDPAKTLKRILTLKGAKNCRVHSNTQTTCLTSANLTHVENCQIQKNVSKKLAALPPSAVRFCRPSCVCTHTHTHPGNKRRSR